MRRIAHRGLHDREDRPENSPAALAAAWNSDADGVEVDLQMLGDEHIITHHDPELQTPPGSDGRHRALANLTLEDYRRLGGPPTLLLTELLERAPDDRQLILECKPHRSGEAFRRRLLWVLSHHDTPPGLTLSSGDLPWLRELLLTTRYPVAPVVHRLGVLERNYLTRLDWAEYHLWDSLCTHDLLDRLNTDSHRPVIAWTVNDSDRVDELETRGVKGIMTDRSEWFETS